MKRISAKSMQKSLNERPSTGFRKMATVMSVILVLAMLTLVGFHIKADDMSPQKARLELNCDKARNGTKLAANCGQLTKIEKRCGWFKVNASFFEATGKAIPVEVQVSGQLKRQGVACIGTIIDTKLILTAPTCAPQLYNVPVSPSSPDIEVILPLRKFHQDKRMTPEVYSVKEIHHQDIEDNNLALLNLSKSIIFTQYVQPICISLPLDPQGRNLTFAAKTSEGRLFPAKVRATDCLPAAVSGGKFWADLKVDSCPSLIASPGHPLFVVHKLGGNEIEKAYLIGIFAESISCENGIETNSYFRVT